MHRCIAWSGLLNDDQVFLVGFFLTYNFDRTDNIYREYYVYVQWGQKCLTVSLAQKSYLLKLLDSEHSFPSGL